MGKNRIGANRDRILRALGYAGVIGSLIAVGADIALGSNPDGIDAFDAMFSLSVMKIYPLFSETPHWRLLWSNYLAVTGIPLGFLGLIFVYRQFNSGHSIWKSLSIILGVIGYLSGTLFHASLSYIATLLRFKAEIGSAFSKLIVLVTSFSQPMGFTFLTTLFLVSLLFAFGVLRGWTSLPPLFGMVNPVSIQLLLGLASLAAPPALRTLLLFSIFNLSLAIFYAATLMVTARTGRDEMSD